MSVLEQRLPWNFIPADGIGYVNSEDFLTWPDGVVLHFIRTFETHRYQSWRNFNNLWRSTLGLDSTHGKRVKDFGCGFGIEALQFAKSGNEVLLSDIFPSNVQAAERVLRLSGYTPAPDGPVDVFYSNGVLHHSPQMRELLEKEVANLNPGGEVRLLLYSDRAWILTTATRVPPIEDDV
jgi:2-polyprenyl-3-methyl-5-hydroxy-6-metoxy-1,4-benzoquinol methylase